MADYTSLLALRGAFSQVGGHGILTCVTPYSLYLHIPFCRHRCAYCDFNTYERLEALIPAYVRALCGELRWIGRSAGRRLPVHSLFFGGGTPSLLPVGELGSLLEAARESFELLPGAEITLEANPGTLSLEYLQGLRSLGVNRLSLGMQSAQPGELLLLERQHGYPDVLHSAQWARRAGFDNLNLDLIFGLPGQSLESWRESLEMALDLGPEHLSLYALSLEHGTPMRAWYERGLLPEPDPDLAAEMYEYASQRLAEQDFVQYEISNWARRRQDGQPLACRHNLQYWRLLPYLGFGAGAHGYALGVHTVNVLAPAAYIQRMQATGDPGAAQPRLDFPRSPANASAEQPAQREQMGEWMMMGLRLTEEGISARDFRQRFGQELQAVYGREIERLLRLGLLEWRDRVGERLRLSERARLLGNQVFIEFV